MKGKQKSKLNLKIVALTVGFSFVVFYSVCVLWCLLVPKYAMYQVWEPLLITFKWISLKGFIFGLVESFTLGLYVGIVFGLIYNFLSKRL